ncbi:MULTISPECIES: hypothetical protein [Allobaculum]|uniref:hypothetical protein n=1 Tax=Allobaculum TaxID=174708 RepID=UPI001E499EBC|nr:MULTISPECIES: hypothetical protein [Allobaculum]UNT93156.1 hypothetical protein KWG61_14280 [Allobaculum sp. Allo2]
MSKAACRFAAVSGFPEGCRFSYSRTLFANARIFVRPGFSGLFFPALSFPVLSFSDLSGRKEAGRILSGFRLETGDGERFCPALVCLWAKIGNWPVRRNRSRKVQNDLSTGKLAIIIMDSY